MFAQKIRYVNTAQLTADYPAWQEVEREIAELQKEYEAEYLELQNKVQKLYDELQNQSLLLSPEKKQEKENELGTLNQEMQRYQYEKLGPQGELYRKAAELQEPIINKIYQVIDAISVDKGYDYVIDNVKEVFLFAKEEYDITSEVLDELKKTQ